MAPRGGQQRPEELRQGRLIAEGRLGEKTGGMDLGFGWSVRDALRLDRAKVRQQAVERFGADRMVEDYLRVYEQILR